MEFKELQLEKVKEINDVLNRYLPAPAGYQAACMEDMSYSVLGGGKRLRPMLMRETCALFTEDTSVAEPFMAAIEMIHSYSLVHDDIMDDDDTRRGRQTVHAKYREKYLYGIEDEPERESDRYDDELKHGLPYPKEGDIPRTPQIDAKRFGDSMGILAGDALLTYAFQIMAEAAEQEFAAATAELTAFKGNTDANRAASGMGTDIRVAESKGSDETQATGSRGGDETQATGSKGGAETQATGSRGGAGAHAAESMGRAAAKVRAMSLIAKKAGIYGMVGGQVIDVQNVGVDMTAAQVKNINELKTSALIEASMMAGAILGGADVESVGKIEHAASMIGQAFQIEDDILDVTGNAGKLGKPVGSDDKNDKNTYVRIYGIEKCRRMVEELSEEAIRILFRCNFTREPDGFLEELLRSLVNRDH